MTDPIPFSNPPRVDDPARLTAEERETLYGLCDDWGIKPSDLTRQIGYTSFIDRLPEAIAAKVWAIRQRRPAPAFHWGQAWGRHIVKHEGGEP